MELSRWTPLTFLVPGRYVDRDGFWADFDLEAWSRETYGWDQDPWNGWWDFAARPRRTVELGHGDCEDYALVAISWAVANDRQDVRIAFCWKPPWPIPRHVLAADARRVYSSGDVVEATVDDWVANSETYEYAIERAVD